MMYHSRILKAFRDFVIDEKGSVTIEAVLIVPVLVWAIVAMLNFWDVFRSYNQFQKAAHTVSNTISRTKKAGSLTAQDMRGYYRLMNFLMPRDNDIHLRISAYTYSSVTKTYTKNWSCNMGSSFPAKLTNADLATMKPKLPVMANGDVHILLEARFKYEPLLNFPGSGAMSNTGLLLNAANVEERQLREFISERPRDGSFSFNEANCPTTF